MIARRLRPRSGITLTEILIAILIMGIGLISLATLFPLGLIRLREAARYQRSGLLVQSGSDDMDARALLSLPSFTRTWYGTQNPFVRDQVVTGTNPVDKGLLALPVSAGGTGIPQPGLPVCYDPLWRVMTNIVPFNNAVFDSNNLDFKAGTYSRGSAEARFGCGIVVDPSSGNANDAYGLSGNLAGEGVGSISAYGLQRITNFIPWSPNSATYLYPYTYTNPNPAFTTQPTDVAGDTFISIDDIVFNDADNGSKGAGFTGTGTSPLLPDLSLSGNSTPMVDYRYSWFFTGQQVDTTNTIMFQGDMVICDARPFAYDPILVAGGGATVSVPTGETVVEAIFGYSKNVNNSVSANTGFAVGADKTVLIRWPNSIPDPMVRVGGWIADVTYERYGLNSSTSPFTYGPSEIKTNASGTPFQRCFWYQVARRTDAAADPINPNYRQMILTISGSVRSKTLLNYPSATPVFTNAALIMPSVINVYSRTFEVSIIPGP